MNQEIAKFNRYAQTLNLEFKIQQPILPKEPVLAIVHTRLGTDAKSLPLSKPTLTITSRNEFAKAHGFTWIDEVFASDSKNQVKLAYLKHHAKFHIEKTKGCEKALLETDYGFATINLTPIKKDEAVVIYEGEFLINEKITFHTDARAMPKENEQSTAYTKKHDLQLYYDKEDKTQVSVSGKKYRGFGVFMQSLIEKDMLKYYQFTKENQQKVALVNLERMEYLYPVFRATEDIPPLSLLGISYQPSYFVFAQIPCVPFNKEDGFSLPYELDRCHITFFEKNYLSDDKKPIYAEYIISKKTLFRIIDDVSEEKAVKFQQFYLKEAEGKLIADYVSKKITHFVIEITNTPDILPFKQAAIYSSYVYSPLLSYATPKDFTTEITKYQATIQSEILNTFARVEYKKTSLDFQNPDLPNWLQYLSHQHLYFSSLNKLFDIILKSCKDKTPKEKQFEALITKYKCGSKEKFPSEQYPITLRNAAVNLQTGDLWFLIKESKATDYINSYSESSKKTALHLALESKKQDHDKLATVLLLLECKADPTLKDGTDKTPLDLSPNAAFTFLFKRAQTGKSDPDGIVEKIKTEAAKQGFGLSFE